MSSISSIFYIHINHNRILSLIYSDAYKLSKTLLTLLTLLTESGLFFDNMTTGAPPYRLIPKAQAECVLLCGPEGAGKREWAEKWGRGMRDALVLDPRRSARELGLPVGFAGRGNATRISEYELDQLRTWRGAVCIIRTAPRKVTRDWWMLALGERATCVVLNTPASECRARVMADPDIPASLKPRVLASIGEWHRIFKSDK